jgi:hypothetical protein
VPGVIGNPMQTAGERWLTALGLSVLVVLVVLVRLVWWLDRGQVDGTSRGWRWLNLITAALVAVLAVDLLPDLVEETEWSHRADEIVIELLAAVAIVWYAAGRRRLTRSLTPLALAAAVEAVKVLAIPVEWADSADVQGDIVLALIGVPVLTALALLYVRGWRRPMKLERITEHRH